MGNQIVIESEGIQLETEEFRYVEVNAHFKYEVPSDQISLPNGQSCSINPKPPIPPESGNVHIFFSLLIFWKFAELHWIWERTRENGVYCAEKMPSNIDFNEMPMYVSEDDCFQECDAMVECQGELIFLCEKRFASGFLNNEKLLFWNKIFVQKRVVYSITWMKHDYSISFEFH